MSMHFLAVRYRAARAAGLIPILLFCFVATSSSAWAMGYASRTCKELWEHKDQIYYDNGYCHPDSQAAAQGDKARCTAKQLSDVAFSNDDLQNLMLIARNEARKNCPKASPAPGNESSTN